LLKEERQPLKIHDGDIQRQEDGAENQERYGEWPKITFHVDLHELLAERFRSSKEEPPEEHEHRDQDRREQRRPRPPQFFVTMPFVIHGPVRFQQKFLRRFELTRSIYSDIVVTMKLPKVNIADIVIFLGLGVNLVIIILILYYFVI
jgi:hypothetical protein